MENARQRVNQITVDIMRASRVQPTGGMAGGYGMPQQQQVCTLYSIVQLHTLLPLLLLLPY